MARGFVRRLVDGDQGGVEHQGVPLCVAGAGVGLQLAGEHDRERAVVLGDLVAELSSAAGESSLAS